jgi:hypothetical protein
MAGVVACSLAFCSHLRPLFRHLPSQASRVHHHPPPSKRSATTPQRLSSIISKPPVESFHQASHIRYSMSSVCVCVANPPHCRPTMQSQPRMPPRHSPASKNVSRGSPAKRAGRQKSRTKSEGRLDERSRSSSHNLSGHLPPFLVSPHTYPRNNIARRA